jgi:hypothetical protein
MYSLNEISVHCFVLASIQEAKGYNIMVHHMKKSQMLIEWTKLDSMPPEIAVPNFLEKRAGLSYPENQLFRIYESLIARGTRGPAVGRKVDDMACRGRGDASTA